MKKHKDEEGNDSENTEKANGQKESGGESPSRSKVPKIKGSKETSDDASPNKPPRQKKKREPAAGGSLSQDFQSFDILWFYLTTKTRALVTELC